MFKSILIYLISAGMIMSTGSLYKMVYGRDLIPIITLILMLILLFIQIIKNNENSKISISSIIGLLFFMVIPFLIDLINAIESFQIVFFYFAVITISFLIKEEDRIDIFRSYLNLIAILSVISILYYFLNIFYSIDNIITPIIYYRDSTSSFSWQIFPLWVKMNLPNYLFISNQSIFFEPGAYVVHLILGTLLSIKNQNKIILIILISALITTFSTTGYIFLVLFTLYQTFYRKNKVFKFRYVMIFLFLLSMVLNNVNIEGQNWKFLNRVTKTFITKFNPNSTSYQSFDGRYLYFMESSKMFFDSYLIGNGHYSTEFSPLVTKTPSSSLSALPAELGLFGVFCIFLYAVFFSTFKILSIPITFLWLNGEFMCYDYLLIFILAHQGDITFKKYLNFKRNKKYSNDKIDFNKKLLQTI